MAILIRTIRFGLAATRMPVRLDRVAATWFLFGEFLGPIALIVVALAVAVIVAGLPHTSGA